MSKQTDLLELEKCIVSRLWYTAVTIVRHQTKTTNLKNLTDLIGSCADQGIDEQRWIAYNLLFQLDNNEEAKKILAQEEFGTTLRLLDIQIPHHTKEELLKLFASVRAAEEGNDVSPSKLSRESLECLETNLLESPVIVHWIIDGLLCLRLPTRSAQSDSALQDVYFHSIRKLFRFDTETAENEETISVCLPNNCQKLENKRLGVLLSILSKINLTESKEDELTTWLYPVLHDRCNSDDIELALYSRKNSKLFKTWHEFVDDKYARCHAADNLENSLKISKILFDSNDDSNTSLNANEIFKRTLRRQSHWLMDIFDICYVLLINEHHKDVEKILNNLLLKDLWLLLLFKLLNDCSTEPGYSPETCERSAAIFTALRYVLKKSEKSISDDPTLIRLKNTLNNHLNVLDWILERKKSSSLVNDEKSVVTHQNYSVEQILQFLCNHSILAVIKMTTNIHENNYDDVGALLKDEKYSQSTFQAYHAMLSALKAILLCESYNSTYQDVAERFDDMEKSLGGLFPLDLRLEVIENIFSMLFLRHEDFVEAEINSDGGEKNYNQYNNTLKSKAGFLCNKYATRETLNRLKRSVKAVEFQREEEKKLSNAKDGLETRIFTISKSLADAAWRLELLTSSDFIEKIGNPDVENHENSEDDTIRSFANRLNYCNSKNERNFYKPNESSSDESAFGKSDSDGNSQVGSQKDATNIKEKRRKKLRKKSSVLETSTMLEKSKNNESTLNYMLASKESLVLQCLWKSDYDKALQVIEVFGLKNSCLESEILFSRAMKVFRKNLRIQQVDTDLVDSSKVDSGQSAVEDLGRVVQNCSETSRSKTLIETFLAAQESFVRRLNSDATTSTEILTMASLDLALTTPQTHQDSLNLTNVAIKYLESCEKLANSRFHDLFKSIHRSLNENNSKPSIHQLLCDAKIPLSVEKAKQNIDYWSCLEEKLRIFRNTEDPNVLDNSSHENSTNTRENNFTDIIKICDNGELYLSRLHAHLEILRTIIPEEASETRESNFSPLKISLDSYIGDQIFRLNLDLEAVETIASRLRINLVHSILVNCCPKLIFHAENRCRTFDKWGSTVLNEITESTSKFDNYEPNRCVEDILSELLKALRAASFPNSSLTPPKLLELSKNDEIRKILSKTRRLAKIDLSNLSCGNQTLSFFVNIWNLMFLHAMLDIWSLDPPMNDLRHEMSLTTIGYEIGDLGTVSLQALRFKLLGQSFWAKEFFSNTEELNEPAWQDLDVPQDPRVVFAVINEFNDSPVVRIYNQRTLNEYLNNAVADYTNYYNKNNDQDDVLCLPELIKRYHDLTSKKLSNTTNFIDGNIAKSASKVAYKTLNYTYDVRFDYANEKSRNVEIFTPTETPEFPWQSRIVETNLLQYLEGHCWLLSYLVQRIHEESPTISDSSCENIKRTSALENLVKSSWANDLKSLYEENPTVAGLRKITLSNDLWNYFQSLLTSGEMIKCLNVIEALPDCLVTCNAEIQRFKDVVLANLATNSQNLSIGEILRYVYQIRDVQILVRLILSNSNDLPVKVCRELLSHALTNFDRATLPQHCRARLNEISCRVDVFQKMLPYCVKPKNDDDCWHDLVNRAEKTNPVKIVESLIDANQFELCLEWLQYQAVSSKIHLLISQDLLVGLLNNDDQDFKHSTKLLRALPLKKSLNLCNGVMGKLESMAPMRFVVGYLLENSGTVENERHRRGIVGIDILEQLDVNERRSYVHLIEQPLLMLEQLLMNCRLEILQRILVGIRDKFGEDGYGEKFDETVRFYATKSLDFRVVVQGELERIKDAPGSNVRSQNGEFVMPVKIPTKDEWVPNDKARECSCCGVVIFTMFNRRHHCRRCGRVVCATCSPQRMRLPNYPNSVPVRVCNDCKRQMVLQLQAAQVATSTPSSSEAFEYWRLAVDEAHNKTLRDEFSFENAPNISLCLAILNLHSDNETYSNFLLDRCDDMKSLLRPDSKGRVNPEVDHALIIKMIKSLLIAAKVKCAELGLNTGLTHCDGFLSQVDLITTLINSDCSSLIPRTDDPLDDHTLRRLRDLLTEKERWTTALDVSTKTGQDTQGVWAAWGTACLKAGYYDRARDKFVHCLDKVIREDTEDWVMLSHPGESTHDREKRFSYTQNPIKANDRKKSMNTKPQEGTKNRPTKDAPLLTEILQILDKMNPNDWYIQQNSKSMTNSAQEILNTLNSLKSISQGQNSTSMANTGAKNFRYHESLYYLLMYGSYNSILDFFVKHGEYEKCLDYILENDVDSDLFTNVFIRCLKNGCVVDFCEAMRTRDSTLVIFKKYLMNTCHCLEKKKLLNTLHQLQLFMKDYVRAAMTCIRFYVNDATTYGDLCTRTHFLSEAQKHLESELQLENFGQKRRRSVSSSMSGQCGLTLEMDTADIDRHMNTICRQMEIAKFLGNREQEGHVVNDFMNKLSYMDNEGALGKTVPTLFGNQQEKTHLAVLAILCGRDVEEGFGIAFRIMQDYNLRQQKIYSLVGHMLALERKTNSIEQLIKCCRSSGAPNSNAISDRVLAHCVKLLLDRSRTDSDPSPKDQIDSLIRIITDVELKIESYIESRQLKAAYLLAVKHSRAQDIRKILKEADRLGQLAIKSICTKWLQQTQGV